MAGLDSVIRAYDLTTGNIKTFEGHRSWVLCMATHVTMKDDGERIDKEWLFSSSDDGSIRVWDIQTGQCLDELLGHKNGVTCLTFADNRLFSGSFDHYVIVWNLTDVQNKI